MTNAESKSKRSYDRKFFNNKSYYQNYEQILILNRDNFNLYRALFKTNNAYHNNLQSRNHCSSRIEIIIKIKRKTSSKQNFSMFRHDLNDKKKIKYSSKMIDREKMKTIDKRKINIINMTKKI